LKELLNNAERAAIHPEALRTLAALDPAAAVPLAKSYLDTGSPALRAEAILVLGAQPDGAKLVGQLFLAGKLPPATRPQVIEALRRHADQSPELKQLLDQVMKPHREP
jgi:HEAT repeat protein